MSDKVRIIVLGAGLVGRPMALDLIKDGNFAVTIADINIKSLDLIPESTGITKVNIDLSNKLELRKLLSNFDYVINAVPGFMGYETVKTIIRSGKDVVDIAFFPEEPYDLDELALENNVSCIVDS